MLLKTLAISVFFIITSLFWWFSKLSKSELRLRVRSKAVEENPKADLNSGCNSSSMLIIISLQLQLSYFQNIPFLQIDLCILKGYFVGL